MNHSETIAISLGASQSEAAELSVYDASRFEIPTIAPNQFPLPDENFVATWETYVDAVETSGSITSIYPWLPQLQFPIQEGMAKEPAYQAAISRGLFSYPSNIASGLPLEEPKLCKLHIHPSLAGRIPVFSAGIRSDFISLVRAFIKKNEPAPIPASMGAVIIGGYNNFHRIHCLRETFLGSGESATSWPERFQQIKQEKALYHDRFILLSPGPYSAVTARTLGLCEQEWLELSRVIRLEHECTHYFTRRVFFSMQNNLLDELLADFCGIEAASGQYRADWALAFLGLEDSSSYRNGGRLENYRGTPSLSEGSFVVLQKLVRKAITHLEQFSLEATFDRNSSASRVARIFSIASHGLHELAKEEAVETLKQRFHSYLELSTDAVQLKEMITARKVS